MCSLLLEKVAEFLDVVMFIFVLHLMHYAVGSV
jgi:hypothetical protein